ncbi:MAG TPA: aminopeptidase P N-terminal domain-containing protein [Vicinamibacterales bacterium]|nr:aminopeptidase P N-terminal domain-containing protein [Vicinamibacterales bacterium]
MTRSALILVAVLAGGAWLAAQPVYRGTDVFPAEEFAGRRQKVMAQIGEAVAVVRGTTEPPGEMPLRQNNQFFYLTGVVEPRAAAIIDGRSKRTTIFLLPRNERRETSAYGPALTPGPEAVKATGAEAVVDVEGFSAAIQTLAAEGRTIYTPHRAEVLGSQSSGDPTRLWAANQRDPWDGRTSRELQFVEKLKAAAPRSEIKDLDPILDALRAVKSAREIAVIREATRIAGLGIMEAMRDARPGMYEYELQADAEFVFKKHGAFGPSYFALVATGPNTYYTHYHRATAKLADGDLVQFDYAPDFKNHQSDVTRIFPANGRFSPRQREMYTIYLRLYQALLTSIEVHATPADVVREAVGKMDRVMTDFTFTDAKVRAAAERMVAGFRNRTNVRSLGHNVGLEVHDVGGLQAETFEPGRIFTIEPQFRIEDEHLGLRLEDMILITETGVEIMSAFVPIEIADIEKLMAEPGLSDRAIRR